LAIWVLDFEIGIFDFGHIGGGKTDFLNTVTGIFETENSTSAPNILNKLQKS
jgi:hypothetical protein